MFKVLSLPLIVMSAQTTDVLAIRVNDPNHPQRGAVRLLRSVESYDKLSTIDVHTAHQGGHLSDYGVYNRIENLFPMELGQVDVDPFSEIDVRWNMFHPTFVLKREPHIFPSMVLQNQMVMARINELPLQDRLLVRGAFPAVQFA